MATHEFDLGRSHSDTVQVPSSDAMGMVIAHRIRRHLREQSQKLPEHAQYLALGAGYAINETRIAVDLGIEQGNITLVDRNYPSFTQAQLHQMYPDATIIDSGLFTYLRDNPTPRFSLVTLIGAYYIFDEPEKIETFIEGLSHVVLPGGIVTVDMGDDFISTPTMWQKAGFQSLGFGNGMTDDYCFQKIG